VYNYITNLEGKQRMCYTSVVDASLTNAFQGALRLVANSLIFYVGKHCILQSKKDWVFSSDGIKETVNDTNDFSRNLEEFKIDNYFPMNWRIRILWRSREKDRNWNKSCKGRVL